MYSNYLIEVRHMDMVQKLKDIYIQILIQKDLYVVSIRTIHRFLPSLAHTHSTRKIKKCYKSWDHICSLHSTFFMNYTISLSL